MKAKALLASWGRALDRLGEALAEPESDIVRDAAIQRFEFCFELAWKAIQKMAAHEDMPCRSPRDCLRTAFRLGWIDDDAEWMRMVDDRNRTSHTYEEAVAKAIYGRLPGHLERLRRLHAVLEEAAPRE